MKTWKSSLFSRVAAALGQSLRASWPQLMLGLVLVYSGYLNLLSGLHLPGGILQTLSHAGPLPQLSNEVSLVALGSGTQAILGGGLVLVGIGLFFRLRSAWAFAMLLLAINIGVDLATKKSGLELFLPVSLLIALLLFGGRFVHRTLLGNSLISLISILAVLAYGVFGSYLLGSGFNPPIHGLSSALYFTVVTLSTVGFGDIIPHTAEARYFVVSLITVGLSIFATVVISTLGPALSGELSRLFAHQGGRMKLKGHTILVGEGSVARNTARELNERDKLFVWVVTSADKANLSDAQVVIGDASEEATLIEAGVKNARLLIAAREDDGENAFIALLGKDLNPEVHVLAVASSARAIHRLKLARADLVFAPAVVGARLLADLVEGGSIPEQYHDLLQG